MGRPSDSYSTAESLGHGTFSRDLLPHPSSHKCAVSWHTPWLEAAVESLNETGGRGNTAPAASSHLQRKTLVRLERSFVDVPQCPTNWTGADAINHVFGYDCGYLDELATGHLSTNQRGRVSLPRVQGGTLSPSELLTESAPFVSCWALDAHLGL